MKHLKKLVLLLIITGGTMVITSEAKASDRWVTAEEFEPGKYDVACKFSGCINNLSCCLSDVVIIA